ncbi:MAG: hypothetical protein UX49_C0002G0039 [Candidatus Wolfebacteria bacterium GW2011_GWC2_46_275]|uniref:Uncharacterized protein n=2 Tax=Candidatus Wolfeibacteriota TaxID=1752735 RepID=A0A0G1U7J7_9BACT|nr:MAG: hypothetical protein UX70_C0001G0665 [Candidatus Wolfebacteria bacterium GW2011_GWB1_47_1]KKU37114.1 MAG: hypothetical protein UX49_C0002G0039 [Candidatus Wolfebacteria bacterium GW2011_GWC2_46_275]KKU42410.1 MAG: hypothetical protein UX58_C0002G0124 [Candidatus Wolfebacteria bacterium GW2011_GWB2_46_69]KKU54378.1 MAG: hypothetical protein UX76_C0003G0074 [Candidatus Wolfebacteria bacterium GW2011_GWC1_47_103]KKU58714.1 MAG: hypothetical protein UX83_C0013G0024 [Candidatus Wolfebacteria
MIVYLALVVIGALLGAYFGKRDEKAGKHRLCPGAWGGIAAGGALTGLMAAVFISAIIKPYHLDISQWIMLSWF